MKKLLAAFMLIMLTVPMACSSGKDGPTGPNVGDSVNASDYTLIPLGANAFVRSSNDADHYANISDDGIFWRDPNAVFDIYFRVNVARDIKLALELYATANFKIQIDALDKSVELNITGKMGRQCVYIGEYSVAQPGYVKVSLSGNNSGSFSLSNIGVAKRSVSAASISYTPTTSPDIIHFGRRGPMPVYWWTFPSGRDIEWFYNEITIEEGNDVIQTYWVANGSYRAYFGMQVNSETERRVLHSVWSPHQTDNPNETPEYLRTEILERGPGVAGNDFGGEGSGSQTYLIHPWKAGATYRFLKRIRPMDSANTLHTAYFFDPAEGQWRLISTIRRPTTAVYYESPYSFIECFSEHFGQFTRCGLYGNQWARSKEGEWIEITSATYMADGSYGAGLRKDSQAGVTGNYFFLRGFGFFSETTQDNSSISRPALGVPPDIDFSRLPGEL